MTQSFDGERAFDHLRMLVDRIGDRRAGSPGERTAAKGIADHFRSLGLKTTVPTFPVDLGAVEAARLEVDGLGPIPCAGMTFSRDTPARGVRGEVVFAETGESVYLTEKLAGRIVFLAGMPAPGHYERLMAARPAALVIAEEKFHSEPCEGRLRPEWRQRYGAVPTVRISFRDGLRLLRSLPAHARVVLRATETRRRSRNVVAEIPGREDRDEICVICAHYDSVYAGPGASDNAAGAAIVMELARLFAETPSRRTLRFVAFGGEEIGLYGSIAYVSDLRVADAADREKPGFAKSGRRTELERHRFVVNVDVQGAALGRNSAFAFGPPAVAASVLLLSSERGPFFRISDEVYSSDNAPFGDAGIPSISFGRAGGANEWGHSPGDIVEYLDAEHLSMTGEFVDEYLRRYVGNALFLPFDRAIPDEQSRKLAGYFRDRTRLDAWKTRAERKPRRASPSRGSRKK